MRKQATLTDWTKFETIATDFCTNCSREQVLSDIDRMFMAYLSEEATNDFSHDSAYVMKKRLDMIFTELYKVIPEGLIGEEANNDI